MAAMVGFGGDDDGMMRVMMMVVVATLPRQPEGKDAWRRVYMGIGKIGVWGSVLLSAGKVRRKSFPAAAAWWWPESGGGRRWAAGNEGESESGGVSGKTEKFPEIDMYQSQFKSKFTNKDMKEEFLDWFGSQIRQRHIDKDPGVKASSELFALACGPTPTPISVNSCVVNGMRFVVHSRDESRTTQNIDICSPSGKNEEMYYGQLQEILEFSYLLFKVVLFRVKWFDTSNEGRKVKHLVLRNNMTQIWAKEDDPDVIHFDNSSNLALSASLNDLDFTTLHIDGQSTDVDAPPDIIDVDEDDDIIDDEDALPYDLADSDDEDLVNLDIDDGVNVMSADVARGHDGDGGGDDHPPSHQASAPENPIWVTGKRHTHQETQNLGLKKIMDVHGPVLIRFEWNDRETLMPLGDHAAHWANYLGELVRELPMHYPSWRQVPAERKAGVLAKIGTQFDLKPHMESERWPKIYTGIQQHLQKIYNGNKSALKAQHWVQNPETGTYDVESIRRGRPANISATDWDAQIAFWNDPKNLARCAQNRKNRAKSTVVCRQGSRSLAALRDQMMESSATQEYPSLIQTFFQTHTVGGVFLRDEDRAIYKEMLRLQGLGSNTETGVPYTKDKIMAIV
ncbi:retrotransposon protein, putative, ty3-gypsy subclass [Tanacetum coccineum]